MNDLRIIDAGGHVQERDAGNRLFRSPITQGLQPTYEYVAQQRPDVWNHKPEAFMDGSFIGELEKTGFIKNLTTSVR